MPDQDENLTQEEINDRTGPATGNAAKALKNEMHAWVAKRIEAGGVRKVRAIEEAERKFGVPYRTGGKASNKTSHAEIPQPTEPAQEDEDDDEQDSDQEDFMCPECGRLCKTAAGLASHSNAKH